MLGYFPFNQVENESKCECNAITDSSWAPVSMSEFLDCVSSLRHPLGVEDLSWTTIASRVLP